MSIPATNEIKMYFHCKRCLAEKPPDISPRDWAATEAGFTPQGIQIWCKRHEINIMHMDFEGQKHPANASALED
jgi:hypothetical protein